MRFYPKAHQFATAAYQDEAGQATVLFILRQEVLKRIFPSLRRITVVPAFGTSDFTREHKESSPIPFNIGVQNTSKTRV